MCEAKPGLRCAADTRDSRDDAVAAYRDAYPSGPDVTPVAAAEAAFTGPVTMRFARRTSGAGQHGATYGQDIEPHGRYLSQAEPGGTYPADLYETGEVTFARPLRIPFGGGYSDPDNWKRELSRRYAGKRGRALSEALVADGYDAIITSDKYGTCEVVDLTDLAEARTWTTPAQVQHALERRHPGLSLSMSASPSGHVVVHKIVLPVQGRGTGVGTRVMTDIVQTADRNGWSLALTPSADFGGSKTRLERFYRRFGFVPNKGRAKDYATTESFIRSPQ